MAGVGISGASSRFPSVEILLVDHPPEAAGYAEVLRHHYGVVTVTAHQRTAVRYLERAHPALVVTVTTLEDGSAIDICRTAKRKRLPPPVLLLAQQPEEVPDVLLAGCDGVLVRPVPAMLLVNRVARMFRARADLLRLESLRSRNTAARRAAHIGCSTLGTNRVWTETCCPRCSHRGVTSFDHADHRRSWYACLECKNVWLAKRLEM